MRLERDRREPQPGGPPLGALVQSSHGGVRERDAARLQQPAGLLERESQVVAADLHEISRQAEAMEPEARVLARRQHHLDLWRHSA